MCNEYEVCKRRVEELEADAKWRYRWHARLGRRNMTEGAFYSFIEEQLLPLLCDCWEVHTNLNLTETTCGCPCHK